MDVQFGFVTIQPVNTVNCNACPQVAQVYLELHSFLEGKKKKKKELLTLTHQGCLANMPLGKYLEYIMEKEKSENKTFANTSKCLCWRCLTIVLPVSHKKIH